MPVKKVTIVEAPVSAQAQVPVEVEAVKVKKPRAPVDPAKKIMKYIQKNLEGAEDATLSKDARVLKSLHEAYSSKKEKPAGTKHPKFEKGSEEAKEHMRAIREKKTKKEAVVQKE